MKKIATLALVVAGFSAVAHAAATAPVQRVDLVNLVGAQNANTLQTPITVKFFTAASATAACYTATVPYNGSSTFYAGTGLACTAGVTSFTVTPGTSPASNQNAYNPNTLTVPVPASGAAQYYNTQIEVINGATSPAFSATTGAVATKGTVNASFQQSN